MKAVFIDKDGVVYTGVMRPGFSAPTAPRTLEESILCEGVAEALDLLKNHGYLRILVTNQPDIAYGTMTQENWRLIREEIDKLSFDDVYVCFHGRKEKCRCMKPEPGMFEDAVRKWDIDVSSSFIVGDTENDAEAGKTIGCTTILLARTYNSGISSDVRAKSLLEAAKWIVGHP